MAIICSTKHSNRFIKPSHKVFNTSNIFLLRYNPYRMLITYRLPDQFLSIKPPQRKSPRSSNSAQPCRCLQNTRIEQPYIFHAKPTNHRSANPLRNPEDSSRKEAFFSTIHSSQYCLSSSFPILPLRSPHPSFRPKSSASHSLLSVPNSTTPFLNLGED